MIQVPILLDVHGRGNDIRPLGSIVIVNDGTGTPDRGNYDVEQYDKHTKRVVRKGRVENWPRNSKSPVQLLAAAIKALGH